MNYVLSLSSHFVTAHKETLASAQQRVGISDSVCKDGGGAFKTLTAYASNNITVKLCEQSTYSWCSKPPLKGNN